MKSKSLAGYAYARGFQNQMRGHKNQMGANFWEVLKNPGQYLEDQASQYEQQVKSWAESNLPPEVQDAASKYISENKDKPMELLMAEVQKKFLTQENVDMAAQTGITSLFNRAGEGAASDYQDIMNMMRAGTFWGAFFKGKAPATAYIIGVPTLLIIFRIVLMVALPKRRKA